MNIAFIEIQNFRKLKACRVELAPRETILVGPNNSGKTSAMDAMILFFKKSCRCNIATTDVTLSNWKHFDQIGEQWAKADDTNKPDLSLEQWHSHLPSIDVWLKVNAADIHHVIHILPTLDWTPDQELGVRLIFGPKDIEKMYNEFRETYQAARNTEQSVPPQNGLNTLSLWPKSMRDFLDREFQTYFGVKAYILDLSQCHDPADGVAKPQPLPAESAPMDGEPFDKLFKISIIKAQRGFSDTKTEDDSHGVFATLSKQLRDYFTKHLDPTVCPENSDIAALQAIGTAQTAFDEKLETSFKPAINELQGINYPGFSDPEISLTSKISPIDSLDHKTAVQFKVPGSDSLSLPEQYNGLGYQNIISMVFHLIQFRDEWMRVGKSAKKQSDDETIIEPLHIVLIEEPEAHLHAQVQQVFIKKAYYILRNHVNLKESRLYNTQMIVSTHSSNIAHELEFTCLRYFRREPARNKGEIPLATVVNLSKTFGDDNETSRFAKRYIRSNHCDLFFADAVILIEGSAERMLVPHFIQNRFPSLDQSYLSLLEIGGSHAHRLKDLLETLGLISLIITDLDAIGQCSTKPVFPERGKNYRTRNTTLKGWIPRKESLDELLSCNDNEKETNNSQIRVAYQCPIKLNYNEGSTKEETIPYTFEDSLALTNLELIRNLKGPIGLLKKFREALKIDNLKEASKEMFKSLSEASKAEMALELLYLAEPRDLMPPSYICEGLNWLQTKLEERKKDFFVSETKPEVKND